MSTIVNFSNANNLTNKKSCYAKKNWRHFFGGNSGNKTSNQKAKDISSLPLPSLPSSLPLSQMFFVTLLCFWFPQILHVQRDQKLYPISFIGRGGEKERERERKREKERESWKTGFWAVHVKADGLYNRECAQYPSLKILILDGVAAKHGKQKLNSSGV